MTLQTIINHACQSVVAANLEQSSVTSDTLAIEGMSTAKVRHLVNNLCKVPECSYLEVGSWKGSTLVSALQSNALKRCVAYENFSELLGSPSRETVRSELLTNIGRVGSGVVLIERDFFQDTLPVGRPFNVYLYDGAHSQETQYRHLEKVKPHLDRYSILLVDDWFCAVSTPKSMTFQALHDFRFYVHLFVELPKPDYHGGQGLFVIENLA